MAHDKPQNHPPGACSPPGLVPSKTSPPDRIEVLFDASETARKRIKRLRRSVWASGHLHGIARHGFRPPVAWMVTLTYRGVEDWRPDHVSAATERFRRWCARVRVAPRYLWVAELQQRGAVHYHLIVWLPEGVRMPHWDKCSRAPSGRIVRPMWPHGMTNVEQARTGVGYLMKYVSKLSDVSTFPPGLRLYGVGGLDPQARAVRTWHNLPEWAKRLYGVGDLRRMACGLVVRDTGEILPPMYQRVMFQGGGGMYLYPLREMPPRWHDGAYSRIEFDTSFSGGTGRTRQAADAEGAE